MSPRFHPATDLLGQTAPLGELLEVPLLGVPVRFRSNSPTVIGVAERAFQHWRELPPALIEAGEPLSVDIVVHPLGQADPPVGTGERFVFRAHGASFVAAAGGSMLTAQLAAGRALAFVTPDLADDEAALRRSVVECLGLLLVNYRDRTPVHAAGVVANGRALLLAGGSTAGKSTLCYACLRAGFKLLSEDIVCVSLARGLGVWGHASSIYLLPDAPRFFPELARHEPRLQANGKHKLVVDVGAEQVATHAEHAIVCFVERAAGQASRLEPVDADEATALLADPREPGFDLLRDRTPAVAAALAARGAHRLYVGSNPASAVALLAHLAEQPLW